MVEVSIVWNPSRNFDGNYGSKRKTRTTLKCIKWSHFAHNKIRQHALTFSLNGAYLARFLHSAHTATLCCTFNIWQPMTTIEIRIAPANLHLLNRQTESFKHVKKMYDIPTNVYLFESMLCKNDGDRSAPPLDYFVKSTQNTANNESNRIFPKIDHFVWAPFSTYCHGFNRIKCVPMRF